jgi:hypothetical protein
MLADGIEPTAESRTQYLENLMIHDPEPDFDYDLTVPYEKLFTDPAGVKQVIRNCFGIEINGSWLESYGKEYEAYCQQT